MVYIWIRSISVSIYTPVRLVLWQRVLGVTSGVGWDGAG